MARHSCRGETYDEQTTKRVQMALVLNSVERRVEPEVAWVSRGDLPGLELASPAMPQLIEAAMRAQGPVA